MATPSTKDDLPVTARIGLAFCASPLGVLFPSTCLGALAFDEASAGVVSTGEGVTDVITASGGAVADAFEASAAPVAAAADVARWTTIGIIALTVLVVVVAVIGFVVYKKAIG